MVLLGGIFCQAYLRARNRQRVGVGDLLVMAEILKGEEMVKGEKGEKGSC